ncbi:MAG: hypothetical protein IK099_07095 [Clostridia bacterium]|nr:hypothetical protein [Clostridia bacterium]
MEQALFLLDGRAVPLDFPYLQVFLQGRPRHDRDDFYFRHPPMEQGKRAKLFAPYDALDGYSESVREKNTVYTDRIIPDESETEELNRRLAILHALTRNSRLAKKNQVKAAVRYYVPCTDEHSFSRGIRGQYLTETGTVRKVDLEITRTITVNRNAIPIDDILSITSEKDNLFGICSADEMEGAL